MSHSYYDLANYDAEDERLHASQPDITALCAAATYVGQLLESHGLHYAVQGGFAMLCRGSLRTTVDVDIATDASMRQLWKIMEPEKGQVLPRLIIPNTKLLDKVIRIFVRTGPSHGDLYCTEDTEVEVDLNVFGSKTGDAVLVDHIDVMQVDFEGQIFQINVLDIFFMMRTKLRTLTSRAAARDYQDIQFLLESYGQQVQDIAERLDLQDRAHFVETDVVRSRGPLIVKQYQTLLELC